MNRPAVLLFIVVAIVTERFVGVTSATGDETGDSSAFQCYQCTSDQGKGSCGSEVDLASATKVTCAANERYCAKVTFWDEGYLQYIKRGCAIACRPTEYEIPGLIWKKGTQTRCCTKSRCNHAGVKKLGPVVMFGAILASLYMCLL